ncbi:hypothetical protein LEP1GSC168_1463 [Leptospira santarosai str. HAI134]|uniref:Uncharacterized protein n=1 Tax=Leptospira santarosai TaxID=28183 RepID=A0AB73M7W1_9LEPT|nr:hypothetical protein LEP1GSC168_1463 [Leptospira santarosai str. HAI134]EMP82483.1 hypothetical protein LEP1GSC162_3850 [Leptospira santarosai str. CBC1531]ONF93978.1 hypothetical protein BWD14_04910 [Leptospira santarosai]
MIHSILFGNPEDIDRKFSFRSILLRFLQSILNRNFLPQRSPKVFFGESSLILVRAYDSDFSCPSISFFQTVQAFPFREN